MTDELHEVEVACMASYQQRKTNLYNKQVRQRASQAGDLVLRRFFENTTDLAVDKFQHNWERSYTIVRVGPVGAYTLNDLDRTLVPRIWNAMHLKRYYQ